jgi:hypothetical protein
LPEYLQLLHEGRLGILGSAGVEEAEYDLSLLEVE